jgi:LmbE family N-acetylglucosaminyl deacetylase
MLVLHASPHPDDELVGAPATLMALRDAGHEVVNVACSLGRPEDAAQRGAELEEACRRAGFKAPVVLDHALSSVPREPGPVRDEAERRLAEDLRRLSGELAPELVVGPSPHDRHPGHEIVGRALVTALEAGPGRERLWMWGVWGELPFPTTIVEYGDERLEEILRALEAHESQLARNDYRRLVAGRASAETVLAAELTFGFGGDGLAGPYVEATTEAVREASGWRLGTARRLDPSDPFPEPAGPDIGWWLRARSAADGLALESG